MPDSRTDAIAREAARLIESGRADTLGQAIRAAAEGLGFHDAELPSHGRVRRHAQALAMQVRRRRYRQYNRQPRPPFCHPEKY